MATSTVLPGLVPASVPEDLRTLHGWLCWRYEAQEDPSKPPLKVPYYAAGGKRVGRQGTIEDRAKLVDFDAAREAAERRGMTGVGFAPLPEFNITALDFDKCIGEGAPTIPPEITALISRTYVEYSPSGAGLRAFVRGDYGNRKARADDEHYGFETFSSSGFVTVTGRVLPAVSILGNEHTIADLPDLVGPLCEARFGARRQAEVDRDDFMLGHAPKLGLDVAAMEELLAALDPDMGRDQWIRVGMALHHETEGDDTGFDLWNDWSAEGSKYPGEEGLRTQWASFERRKGDRRPQVTMATVKHMAKSGDASGGLGEEDLRAIMGDSPPAQPLAAGRSTPGGEDCYRVVTAAEVAFQPPAPWLIKGVLPEGDLIMLYGASGSGKTFVALDMAAALARGVEWRGRRVRKMRVTIIAAEGGGGIGKRLRAYCKHHGVRIEDLDISVILAAPNFLQDEDITKVVRSLSASGGCDVLIVDTLAQVTPGANENGAEDMGRALRNIRLLRQVTGAVPIVVHHAGKDQSRGARGWSGIRAAADAEIEIIRHEDGQREIRLSKLKDGDDGLRWGFRLEEITLEMDADGDIVTSCVAVEAAEPVAPATEEKERKNVVRYGHLERHILEVIELEWPQAESAPFRAVVEKCVELLPKPDPGKRDQRKYNVQRALHTLAKRKEGPVAIEHGRVIFCA